MLITRVLEKELTGSRGSVIYISTSSPYPGLVPAFLTPTTGYAHSWSREFSMLIEFMYGFWSRLAAGELHFIYLVQSRCGKRLNLELEQRSIADRI